MARFPFPIPYGWFYLTEDKALETGQILNLRRFGEDVILWRDEEGEPHLQEAYCPHLGANIGVGGKVKGKTIECPFHHWRFDAEGSVAEIPYATKVNPYACLRTYPVKLHYGNLMAWYHPDGAAPFYDLPVVEKLETGEYRGPISQSHIIRTCVQEMAENTVDGAHFQTIHNHPGAANYERMEFDGHLMIMDSKQMFPSSQGPVEGTLSTISTGFGFAVVQYNTLAEICMVTVNCPIEDDVTEQVFQVYYRNPQGDPKLDRIGQAFATEVNRQLMDDVPIWENKIYRERPYLCDGDGPFFRFRRWAEQFYQSEAAGASAPRTPVEEYAQ